MPRVVHHNAQKTHCKWGHAFTPENTLPKPSRYGVGRDCKTCRYGRAERARRARGVQQRGRRTHCVHGHAFTPENTFIRPSKPNARGCRECGRAQNRVSAAKKRATPEGKQALAAVNRRSYLAHHDERLAKATAHRQRVRDRRTPHG